MIDKAFQSLVRSLGFSSVEDFKQQTDAAESSPESPMAGESHGPKQELRDRIRSHIKENQEPFFAADA